MIARLLGKLKAISFNSISTRLYLAFATVTALSMIAAAIAWTVFGTTKATLSKLSHESLPVMTSAINLQEQVSSFAKNLAAFGTVESESERNTAYLGLMKGSSEIDDSMYSVSETVKGDKGALARMMDIGATLTTSITAVNNAVTKRIAAANKRRDASDQITDLDEALRKNYQAS